MKYLLLFVVLAVLWKLWKKRQALGERSSAAPVEPVAVNMVRCAYCGVNFPENDAVGERGAVYCSEAHRQAAGK